jgi:hypothetical protein
MAERVDPAHFIGGRDPSYYLHLKSTSRHTPTAYHFLILTAPTNNVHSNKKITALLSPSHFSFISWLTFLFIENEQKNVNDNNKIYKY